MKKHQYQIREFGDEVKLLPRIGDKIRHKKLRWECTVTAIESQWVEMETGLGFTRTLSSAHVRRAYEAA